MVYLVYVSSATTLMSEEELVALLQGAREINARQGITGLLLYSSGNFIQVIEGEEVAVEELFQKISLDPRHSNIIILLKRPLQQRMFADWSMGFKALDHNIETLLPGFSQFMNNPQLPETHTETAQRVFKLLLSFRNTIR